MLDIVLAADKKFYPATETLVYSVMSSNSNIHFHLFTMDWSGLVNKYEDWPNRVLGTEFRQLGKVTDFQIERLKKIIRHFDNSSKLSVYDVKEQYNNYLNKGPNITSPFTPFATLRLLTDIVLPKKIKNSIYFDSDMICFNKLDFIFDKYKTINFPAICPRNPWDAYSSCIIFLNLDICKKTDFFKKSRDLICQKPYLYPDMDAISEMLETSFTQKFYFEEMKYEIGSVDLSQDKIIHLSGKNNSSWQSDFFEKNPQLGFVKNDIDAICGPVEYFYR